MNISYTILEADLDDLTMGVLYDDAVGKFSLIAVTAEAIRYDLNTTEITILDDYEEEFGVAEALMGPVPSGLIARYGVSSFGTEPRFTSLKWASNGLINLMNTSMSITTLESNTTVYAYGGNATQTNPVIWSFTSGNKIRVASSIGSLSPYTGDEFSYWVTFWLASKLSSANKILKFYWSIDIDDVDNTYGDGGIFGAPPVSNLYFNGSDVNYMMTNFITPYGFNPTLAVEYSDIDNINMTTTYPALYRALMTNADKFDFTPHNHELFQSSTTYGMALDMIRSDRNALSNWGFLPTLYYMVPGNTRYSNVTAPAITDSPVWYVAQAYSSTSDTVPYLKDKLSLFDVWSPSLFRVVRASWTPWNIRTTEQMLDQSGKGTWDKFWWYSLEDMFGTYGLVTSCGGYRIEETHFANWVYGRESADAPSLQLIKNATDINVLPVVPTRSWALAENFYFIRNFNFNATYNISQSTLTYTISKNNPNARDRITLVFEGKAEPVDFNPLILKYDQNSTIVTLNYKTSITLKLAEQETTNPYVTNHETSLLTATSLSANEFSFTISAPLGTTTTTLIYVGDRGKPKTLNGAAEWDYNETTKILTLKAAQTQATTTITIKWSILAGDLNNDGTVDIVDAGIVSAHWYPGPPIGPVGYDPIADINKDGVVDIADMGIVSTNWSLLV